METLNTAVEAACARIEATDRTVRAFLPETDRPARLRREAQTLFERDPAPSASRPLRGILVGIKDIIAVDGFETRAGSALPPELFAGPEASLVRSLRAAGALILGKTVTTEFAYFEPGPTTNPRHSGHTPGGSSSGSAAAVGAGLCPLAVGTQTVGSVIRPAAYCGVVGFKPTFGLLPMDGVVPFSPSVDTYGFFTPDIGAMQQAAGALLPAEHLHDRPWRNPIRLGIPDGPYLDALDADARADFEQGLTFLAARGVRVVRVGAFADLEGVTTRHLDLNAAEAAQVHAAWFDRYADRYRPRTAELIRRGRTIPPARVDEGRRSRIHLAEDLESQMDAHAFDAWASPAATGPAPAGLERTGDPRMNLPWTHAGMPAATLPYGSASNGLPLGLQLVSPRGTDRSLLALAAAVAELCTA